MILSSRINIDEYFKRQSEIKTIDKSFLDSIKELDVLPLDGSNIRFSDDYWIFTNIEDVINKESLKLDFTKVYYFYKDIVKGMIYEMKFLMNLANSTIKTKFLNLIRFLDFLKSKYIVSYKLIDSLIVNEYVSSIKGSEQRKSELKFVVEQFFSFIEENFSGIDYTNARDLLKKNDKIRQNEKVEKKAGKTDMIQADILDSFISCAIKKIESDHCSYKEKLEACLILILSQTGIRIGEARKLKANMDKEISIFDDDETAYYLNYFSFKSKKEAITFLSPIAKKAYDNLLSETGKYREMFKVDYLFINKDTGKMYSVNRLRHFIFDFILRNYKSINCLDRRKEDVKGFHILDLSKYEGTKNVNNYYMTIEQKKKLKGYKSMAIPTPHMFRVTVCTELYNQGVDLDWIREHMNHLYEEMTVHYVRNEKQSRMEKETARALLKEVLRDDVRLIGKDSESMTERIQEFISNNKYNVREDIDVITEELAGKIPIRKKNNGYCIKSAFGRKCSIDSGMNDIYCAFGVCNNHFITYKTIDISYMQFNSLVKTIEYNVSSGFMAQASIELNKLHKLIDDILLPQLKEVEFEISRRSYDEFILDNNNIKECIANIEIIKKEVLKWSEMKMETILKN